MLLVLKLLEALAALTADDRGSYDAQFRGTKRTEHQGGDIYLIREQDVRFILQHPTEIGLRKVDQLWFLDLITNGAVKVAHHTKRAISTPPRT